MAVDGSGNRGGGNVQVLCNILDRRHDSITPRKSVLRQIHYSQCSFISQTKRTARAQKIMPTFSFFLVEILRRFRGKYRHFSKNFIDFACVRMQNRSAARFISAIVCMNWLYHVLQNCQPLPPISRTVFCLRAFRSCIIVWPCILSDFICELVLDNFLDLLCFNLFLFFFLKIYQYFIPDF